MRLQKYLNEAFMTGGRKYGHDFEVFKNPTRKELKELSTGFGFRFILDARTKSMYVTDSELFHRDMIDVPEVGKELGMTKSNWQRYWDGTDKSIEYIFMGDGDEKLYTLNSDVLSDLVSNRRTHAISSLDVLLKRDWSWVKKYGMDPKDIELIISETIELLEQEL